MNGFLERCFFGIPVTSYNIGPKQPSLYSLLTNPRTDYYPNVLTQGEFISVGLVPSSTLLLAYVVFWLGFTGRADQLLGTVRPEVL